MKVDLPWAYHLSNLLVLHHHGLLLETGKLSQRFASALLKHDENSKTQS